MAGARTSAVTASFSLHHRTMFPVARLADIYTITRQRSKLREMRQPLEEAYEKGR